MDTLREDFRHYGAGGLILISILALVSGSILIVSINKVATGGQQALLSWAVFALVLAITSAQHPIRFLKNDTGISVSEALVFLGVLVLGPYHGVLLGAVDMLLATRRLRLKASLGTLNVANQVISIFIAAGVYYRVSDYLRASESLGPAHDLLHVSIPLFGLASASYVSQVLVAALSARYMQVGKKLGDRLRDTWPWEPVSFLAGATVAGLINYAFSTYGLLTTFLTIILVLPVPVVIYYTFKTYHEKLGEQERHYEEVTGIYDSILEMLAMAIDAKDDVTHEHIQRVKLFATRVGQLVGLSEPEVEALRAGALLHDIGKIGVPAYILNKPGKLTQHEFEQMKMHTIIGADMLSNIAFRYPVVPIVRHHHERWDGLGYPDGLKGEHIPITARILTLVDNYDALRSDRPYKKGMSKEEALSYIERNAGTYFDPSLAKLFLSVIDELEAEAATIKPLEMERRNSSPAQMSAAGPAAGYAASTDIDRAKAALNSIAETNQRVTALYDMAKTLASLLPVEDTVAILTNRLSKLIPFTTCTVSLFDSSRSEFEIVHAVGLYADRFLRRRLPAEAGITGWAITNRRPMYNTNPVLDLGFLGPEAANEYKSVIVYPLVKNEESIGAIALYSIEIESYGSDHIQLMESISQPASDAIYNALMFEQAQRDWMTDPATGLPNMRAFSSRFENECARSQRTGTPLSVMLVAVDEIAPATARVGVQAEQLLQSIGTLLRRNVRETDVVARHSVGSYLVLLPESNLPQAREVQTRVIDACLQDTVARQLSISVGMATLPSDGSSFAELLSAAKENSALLSPETVSGLSALFADGDLVVRSH